MKSKQVEHKKTFASLFKVILVQKFLERSE